MISQIHHSTSLAQLIRSFTLNRPLILQLVKREVLGRYKGSIFGLAWSFFNPLVMLAIYTFVFSVVFNARWNVDVDSKSEYALALFIGMIIHGVLAESINRSPSIILGNVSYVKKVVFPLEIFPWVSLGSIIFHAMVSLGVWLCFYAIVNHSLNWTVIFLPVVILPFLFFSMGISWFLASLGVYVRDVGQVTGVISTVLLFLSPVFYPAESLPEQFRNLIYLNPLTSFIEQTRNILMWGKGPDWVVIIITYVLSLIVAWAGFAWFQKTRKGFADVL